MQYSDLFQHQGLRFVESSTLEQDAETIDWLRQRQQQQTFTFSNFNNMNTDVHFDHMGVYVEGSISEVHGA